VIPAVERHINQHIAVWPVEVSRPLRLKAVLRSNKEANGIVKGFWIGKVVFWFGPDAASPLLVTKVFDESVSLDCVKRCTSLQNRANRKIGHAVFPEVFDVAQLSGRCVVFMEALKGPNCEVELSRAIHGPEHSLAQTARVVERQLREIGGLFSELQDIHTSQAPRRWGDWGREAAEQFRRTCHFDDGCLTRARVDEMSAALDEFPTHEHMPLVEDHIANYFPGPRAVDQVHPNIEELMRGRPGIVDIFRFLIAYFRAGPIVGVFSDWLYALAAAVADREGRTIVGPPVRKLLRRIGLNPERADVVWAFVMAAFFVRAKTELEFHCDNPFVISDLRDEWREAIRELVGIHKIISRGGTIDPRPVIVAQDKIRGPLFGQRGASQFDRLRQVVSELEEACAERPVSGGSCVRRGLRLWLRLVFSSIGAVLAASLGIGAPGILPKLVQLLQRWLPPRPYSSLRDLYRHFMKRAGLLRSGSGPVQIRDRE
jgi:hypothetical protein